MKKHGFTLVELLVVVLIVGILSAISLPMYLKSVERARISEALILGKSIKESRDRLIMSLPGKGIGKCDLEQYEEACTDFNRLDINLSLKTLSDFGDSPARSVRESADFIYDISVPGQLYIYRKLYGADNRSVYHIRMISSLGKESPNVIACEWTDEEGKEYCMSRSINGNDWISSEPFACYDACTRWN